MLPPVVLEGGRLRLRPWRRGDEPALARYADNRAIWRNLTDRFPSPYTLADAHEWVRLQESGGGIELAFAIEHEGVAIGAIGLAPKDDLQIKVAEIGYWLGEPFWGRGLVTEAVCLLTEHGFDTLELERIYATVLEWNPASCKVLEKAGYTLEARLARNIFKDGQIIDSFLYARLR